MRPSAPIQGGRLAAILPWIALAACCLAFAAALLLRPGNAADPTNLDWAEVYFHHASARDAVRNQGELPWFSPYVNGGYPLAAYPQNPALSPFLPLTLLFGPTFGPRVTTALVYLLGVLGMALFCRRVLLLPPWPAAFAAGLLACSGWLAARVAGGNFSQVFYFLFPLAAWLLFGCLRRPWLLLPLALTCYAWLAEAKYAYPICLVFLGLSALALGELSLRERKKLVGCLLAATAFSALLGTVKIALMLDLLSRIPPSADYLDMKKALAAAGPSLLDYLYLFVFKMGNVKLLSAAQLDRLSAEPMLLGNGYLGYGLAPLAFFLAALALRPRKSWGLALVFGLGFAMSAAPILPIDPFLPLSRLPVFRSMGDPGKYFNFFMLFSVCAASGIFAGLCAEKIRGPAPRTLAALLFASVAALALFANSRSLYYAFPARLAPVPAGQGFFQVLYGHPFDSYRQGAGVVNWYSRLILPTRARPRYPSLAERKPNPLYRGEAYQLNSGAPLFPRFFYNRIELGGICLGPDLSMDLGRCRNPGRIVVNQNWLPGFSAQNGRAEPWVGLLSVLPEPGAGKVTLRYRPPGLALYAAVSVLSLLCLAGLCLGLAIKKSRKASHDS